MRTTIAITAGLLLLAAVALLGWRYFGTRSPGSTGSSPTGGNTATYVGAQACAGCHAAQHAAWAESYPARAMQVASETTVLGDFADRRFADGAVRSTLFPRAGPDIAPT